jgi:phosphate transport system substrate-binding protein
VKLSTRRAALGAAVVSLSLALTACSDDGQVADAGTGSDSTGAPASGAPAGEDLSGTLNGAGASSQTAAMQAWQAGFTASNPDVTVNYDPVGSGGGREQFLGGAIDFAGSDAYLDDEEMAAAADRCYGGGAINLPTYISPIAVIYNLDGVENLQLSPATIAGIFDQKITNWNDPAIAADNPDATLPDQAITPVNRSDKSGTTENFLEYLSAAAPDAWPHEADDVWPVSGGESAQGTSGVVQAVSAGQGTIGYADASQAGDLGIAAVKVGDEYVEYTPEAAAAVVEASEAVSGRPEGDLAYDLARDTTDSGAYPIVLISYHVACTQYDDPATAELVKAFLTYVASDAGQQAAAAAAGSAPISEGLRQQVQASIDSISAAG